MAIEGDDGVIHKRETCEKCGKSLDGLKRRGARKFCSTLCRTRHFALKRYYDIKGTPEYKSRRREYEKNWRLNNKEKWNEKMKIASKKYRDKKKSQSNLTAGNDVGVGQPIDAGINPSEGQGANSDAGRNDQPSYENNTAFVAEPEKVKNNYGDSQ